MRILKQAIRLMSLVSLVLLATTEDAVLAVFLLFFSSMSLGIWIGEKLR